MPLAAALRQGESEPFGRPWRLIYLGDPLYRLRRLPGREPTVRARRLLAARPVWDPSYAGWPAVEVVACRQRFPRPYAGHVAADRLLEWCRDAAIVELAGDLATPRVRVAPTGGRP